MFVGSSPSFFFNDTATTEIYTLSLHDALPISASVGNFFSGDIQFLAKSQDKATTDGSTGAQTAAGTGVVMDTISGFGTIYRGAVALAGVVTKVDLKWQMNNARMQYGLGSSSAQGYGKGLLEVSGSLEVYFKDFTLYDEFIAESGAMIEIGRAHV